MQLLPAVDPYLNIFGTTYNDIFAKKHDTNVTSTTRTAPPTPSDRLSRSFETTAIFDFKLSKRKN